MRRVDGDLPGGGFDAVEVPAACHACLLVEIGLVLEPGFDLAAGALHAGLSECVDVADRVVVFDQLEIPGALFVGDGDLVDLPCQLATSHSRISDAVL